MKVLKIPTTPLISDFKPERRKLGTKIEQKDRILLVLRGNSPTVDKLAGYLSRLVDRGEDREAVWICDAAIFEEGQEDAWFGQDPHACGVVLDFDRKPVGSLYTSSSIYEIEILFLEALRCRTSRNRSATDTHPATGANSSNHRARGGHRAFPG